MRKTSTSFQLEVLPKALLSLERDDLLRDTDVNGSERAENCYPVLCIFLRVFGKDDRAEHLNVTHIL